MINNIKLGEYFQYLQYHKSHEQLQFPITATEKYSRQVSNIWLTTAFYHEYHYYSGSEDCTHLLALENNE